MNKNIKVACPHCKKEMAWSIDNTFRPFCSQRCRLIDLGDWIDGRHVITGKENEIVDDNSFDDNTTQ